MSVKTQTSLKELLRAIAPLNIAGDPATVISGLRHDSRRVEKGDLFFALPGSKTDGNRFAKQAIESGAAAIISELEPPPPPATLSAVWVQVADAASAMGRIADLYFGHPSGGMTMIGVTGTNGKTTTTYLLEAMIAACGGKPAVAGTVNYRLAGQVVAEAPNTTPISLELERLLARFRDGGATHVAMEVSSHALALKRVEEVDFDAAVFTNLTRDHLDFHKTLDEYFSAKARLFELLVKASSSKKRRLAVINADEPRASALKRKASGADILLYGLKKDADLKAEDVESTLFGTRLGLLYKGRRLSAETSLVGEHNIYNVLAAAGAALGLGLPEAGVLAGLKALGHIPGRLEPVSEGQDFHVFVDYAHTGGALEAVLGYLKRLPHNKLITVFGCGGERDKGKRGPMGVAACSLSDLAIITSDNPRGEDPLAIIADVEEGLKTAGLKNYRIVPDRGEAVEEAIALAGSGDIVLLAGKGHENYQILRDRTVAFDDREAARAALRKRRPL